MLENFENSYEYDPSPSSFPPQGIVLHLFISAFYEASVSSCCTLPALASSSLATTLYQLRQPVKRPAYDARVYSDPPTSRVTDPSLHPQQHYATIPQSLKPITTYSPPPSAPALPLRAPLPSTSEDYDLNSSNSKPKPTQTCTKAPTKRARKALPAGSTTPTRLSKARCYERNTFSRSAGSTSPKTRPRRSKIRNY